MSPRPILKRSPTTSHRAPTDLNQHHVVHFPTSSSLTTHTFSVYSSTAYDRSPIVVDTNTCALPARGCPGRTYTLEESQKERCKRTSAPYFEAHPRAFSNHSSSSRAATFDAGRAPSCSYSLSPPPLVPDVSSESDESDGFMTYSSFNDPTTSYAPPDMHGLVIPKDKYLSYQAYDVNPHDKEPYSPSSALSFLPHPPSPPSRAMYDCDTDMDTGKPKRRRERRHDASRAPDRIPGGVDAFSQESPSTPTQCRSKSRSRMAAFRSTFRVEEDACLGGF
jgi:hypothetical protein